jgi:hypothetical protein
LGIGGGLKDYDRRRRIIANPPKPTARSERADGSGTDEMAIPVGLLRPVTKELFTVAPETASYSPIVFKDWDATNKEFPETAKPEAGPRFPETKELLIKSPVVML